MLIIEASFWDEPEDWHSLVHVFTTIPEGPPDLLRALSKQEVNLLWKPVELRVNAIT